MKSITPKQIAVRTLKNATTPQCRFTNVIYDPLGNPAMCASYLLRLIDDAEVELFSPAFLVAVAYANDHLQLSFKEIAELIRKNIIRVDMDGFQVQTFRSNHPSIAFVANK
jgi:hypothetical protein